MDPTIQAFKEKWAEKSAAKVIVMDALGAAKLAEYRGEDASSFWKLVGDHGFNGGDEGRFQADAQAMADAYVLEHPEMFDVAEQYVSPERHDELVTIIGIYRAAGLEEEMLKLTMFELARFDRQKMGVTVRKTLGVARTGGA